MVVYDVSSIVAKNRNFSDPNYCPFIIDVGLGEDAMQAAIVGGKSDTFPVITLDLAELKMMEPKYQANGDGMAMAGNGHGGNGMAMETE